MPTRHIDARQRSSRRCTSLETATQVSQRSCSRVPVASLASRPARASPATFRVGELGALRRRASVLLKCHRETGRDRGVRVADPTFTSRESCPRAFEPCRVIPPDAGLRLEIDHTRHTRASPSVAPLRFSRFGQKTASVSLFSVVPRRPRALTSR